MEECIFCDIIERKAPAGIQYEDDICMAFDDLYPKKRLHMLIVPKKHIATIAEMSEGDEKIVGHMVKIAKQLAEKNNCVGYQLLFNVGKEGGQVIFHIHLHLMAN
ncbi:histidine triad nucleotide-binding protein [Candidatus Peregrinibacteria bacterium CG_4_9_14_0_2_um_filter_53_11]|nr:MAG: histidine triad nucleotide-binding protein [Candidatus Peregrinibacteria bacterium CG_4_9_14_0_2_um_filter_53_11]